MHVSGSVKAVVEKTSTRVVGIVAEQLASLCILEVGRIHWLGARKRVPFEGYAIVTVLRAVVRRRCQTGEICHRL